MTPCRDCRVDTSLATCIGHSYTVRDKVWSRAKANGPNPRHLCLDCLEIRVGAPLGQADFLSTLPEILARFAGKTCEPKPPTERQHDLDQWLFMRHEATNLEQ